MLRDVVLNVVFTSQAANILGTSAATVRLMERRGLLHPVRTPAGVRLFDRDEVIALARTRANDEPDRQQLRELGGEPLADMAR